VPLAPMGEHENAILQASAELRKAEPYVREAQRILESVEWDEEAEVTAGRSLDRLSEELRELVELVRKLRG
jgi:hypothetical protein